MRDDTPKTRRSVSLNFKGIPHCARRLQTVSSWPKRCKVRRAFSVLAIVVVVLFNVLAVVSVCYIYIYIPKVCSHLLVIYHLIVVSVFFFFVAAASTFSRHILLLISGPSTSYANPFSPFRISLCNLDAPPPRPARPDSV